MEMGEVPLRFNDFLILRWGVNLRGFLLFDQSEL